MSSYRVRAIFPTGFATVSLMIICSPVAIAAKWDFSPALSVKEVYSDNIRLASRGSEYSDWVTQVTPSLRVKGVGARLKVDASYSLNGLFYAGQQNNDSLRQQLRTTANSELVDGMLFLDGKASISQQASSALGTSENDTVNVINRTEVRSYGMAPKFQSKFGDVADYVVRYSYDHLETTSALSDARTGQLALNMNSGNAFGRLRWQMSYNKMNSTHRFDSENVKASLRYPLSKQISAIASVGSDKYSYTSLFAAPENTYWSTGLSWHPSSKIVIDTSYGDNSARGGYWAASVRWNPSARTSLNASVDEKFFGKTFSLGANHHFRRGTLSVSYTDGISTTQSQFQTSSSIDTAGLLNQMLQYRMPNADQRQQGVDALMRAGLPNTISDSVNLLTNRVFLQKRLNTTFALSGVKNTLILSAFHSLREAQTSQLQDRTLLSDSLLATNDKTKQLGGSVNWVWKVGAKTSLNSMLSYSKTSFSTINAAKDDKRIQFGINERITPDINASLSLRHSLQNVNAREIRENAVTAIVSIKF